MEALTLSAVNNVIPQILSELMQYQPLRNSPLGIEFKKKIKK